MEANRRTHLPRPPPIAPRSATGNHRQPHASRAVRKEKAHVAGRSAHRGPAETVARPSRRPQNAARLRAVRCGLIEREQKPSPIGHIVRPFNAPTALGRGGKYPPRTPLKNGARRPHVPCHAARGAGRAPPRSSGSGRASTLVADHRPSARRIGASRRSVRSLRAAVRQSARSRSLPSPVLRSPQRRGERSRRPLRPVPRRPVSSTPVPVTHHARKTPENPNPENPRKNRRPHQRSRRHFSRHEKTSWREKCKARPERTYP